MSNNLNLDTVLQNQSNKEATINTINGNIDAAITETFTADCTSGNVTVTAAQYRTAQRIHITNATTAGRTVTLPAVKRLMLIRSSASNTQNVSVVVGSTSVSVAPGSTSIAYTDGTANGLTLDTITSSTVAVSSTLNDLRLTKLRLTSNLSINSATWTDVTWPSTADQDDVGAFSSGSPTRLTVPSGYTKVRISATIGWTNGAGGSRYARITRGGVAGSESWALDIRGGVNEAGQSLITPWIDCTAGDYFTFGINQNSGSAQNALGGAIGTFGGTTMTAEWWAPSLPLNTQTSSYTAVLADAFKAVEMNSASANNFTVPPNSSVAFPIGTVLVVTQLGAGQTTILAGSGVTIRKPSATLNIGHQYGSVSIRKRGTDEWVISGDLA